ncbi:LOW QUALITY PROTEIN: type IV inositol polyphosphate 5-phosphatase 9-like [Populus alba x Populus x berolinensis]|nr:LOW QUALITY PROTEIN: type IV inositol polyphosphate 5-phosphatase 9-like [Populus alba x Populus x berolinensis]
MAENQEEVMWPRLVTKKILGERLRSNNNFVADFPSNAEASSLLDISSLGPPSLSENNILNQRKHNFQNYKVFISTWNVGGIAPQDDLDIADWLDTPNNMCDIYVFGFQEMVPLRASYVLGSENSKISMKWNSLIREALNKKIQHCLEKQQYNNKLGRKQETAEDEKAIFESSIPEGFRCVISKQMVGILISVWIRSDLRPYVRHLKASCVGCGIMGYLGNKDLCQLDFIYMKQASALCSSSFRRQRGDEKHRKTDVAEIFSRTSFPRGPSRVILLGDLNYRISLPEATTRLLVDRKEWNALLENDQLRMELMSGQVFEGWREGLIKFAPTYKYCLNSNVYFGCVEGQKGGKCDRIIWHGEGLQQRLYTRGESNLSDHRPVKAIFTAQVEVSSTLKGLQKFFLSERFDQITTKFDQMSSSDKFRCRGRSSFKLRLWKKREMSTLPKPSMQTSSRDDAVQLNRAFKETRPQRDSIQQEYEALFSDDLKKTIGSRASWPSQKAVSLWMKSPVERDVTTLRQALTGPIIDIKAATEIICTRISSQIRQIKQVYTPTFGTLLEYDIGYHTSGDHRKFLLAYIDTTRYDGP